MQSYAVVTNRETGSPADNKQQGQFETLETYNDAIKARPQLSDLRWALAPGTMRHMDRLLDSPALNPPHPSLPLATLQNSGAVPEHLWTQNVVGVNNQLLDITYGGLLSGNILGLPLHPQASNWNVSQPGVPRASSRVATNYATLF